MIISIHRRLVRRSASGDVVITIADCYRHGVQLLIDAPPGTPVLRGELLQTVARHSLSNGS
jgi:sRNA-binding carbon storage regulator CsrA